MAATTGFSAGVESNSTQISYAVEATFATAPSTTFQAIRYVTESLSGSKTRVRPQEVSATREAIQGVTTQEQASGQITGALSYTTYDDLFAGALANTWQALQTIAGVAGDITITNLTATTATLSSTTSTKFQNLALNQYVRTLGFSNGVNNGIARVSAKASNQSLTLTTTASYITETPAGTAAQVRASTIQNSNLLNTLYIQEKLSSVLWFRYAGAMITGFSITGSVGQFVQVTFPVIATSEVTSTTDASTGGITAAPTGAIMNTVANFVGIYVNDVLVSGTVTAFGITVTNNGAAMEFGVGTAAAAGVMSGTLEVNGTISLYFSSFSQYALYKAETVIRLTLVMKDAAGSAYVVSLPNCVLLNPQITAGNANSALIAQFSIEGGPQATGGSITLDRLAAV